MIKNMKTKLLKNNPTIVDTTLRDGEQAPGVVFSTKEKIKIASLLNDLRVEEIEIGIPSMGSKEVKSIETVIKQGFNFRTSTWCRALKIDIDVARKTGVSGVNISYPVSEIQLKAIGKNMKWVYQTMPEIVRYAKNYFKYVSIGAQDASRANSENLPEFLNNCFNLQVYRVRIADTVGVLHPISTFNLINDLTKTVPFIPLEFHGHNDLGMATANTIAAIEAGAAYASTTVNGLGERAGNAATEELILALSLSAHYKEKYNTKIINEMCRYVAEVSQRPIPLSKPLVGEMALKHESGIHTNSILTNRNTYQLYNADLIGRQESDFVFGTHSGSNALVAFFKNLSINISKDKAIKLLYLVKSKSGKLKRALTHNELQDIYFNTVQQ